MAVNLLAGMQYMQQQGEQGKQQGLEQRYNRLAGEAFNAPDNQTRDSAIGQIAVNNPNAATELRTQYQQQDNDQLKLLTGAARYLKGALDTKNVQAVQGAWNTVLPGLIRRGVVKEGELSPTWEPSYEATVHQLLAMGDPNASGSVLQSQKIGADGYIYNSFRDGRMVNTGVKADRQAWFRDHPGMEPQLVGKDGSVQQVGMSVSNGSPPQAGMAQGAPQRADMEADIELANAMIAAGIPEAQVDAFLAQRGQRAPAVAPGSFGTPASASLARPSPAQEAAATERAKLQAQLDYLPQQQAIETQGAIDRAVGTERGKAQVEREAAAPKRIKQYEQSLAASKSVRDALDRAIDLTGPTTTGWAGARMRNIEGSDAFDLASQIETVKANLGFDRLQQMRDNSPTGGALGAIAVQELVALQSTIANLDPNQSAGQLKANLQKVQQHYKNWEAAVQQALADEKRSGGGAAPAAGQRTIVRTGTSNGRKVIQYSDGSVEYGN